MPTLHWLTRDEDLLASEKVPYRLLEEVPELSYTDKDEHTENMLIQGDNLEALKALLPFYAGRVKCIFIDPPYNSMSANITQYDDNLQHSQWLQIMTPRLELLREMLSEDGLIFVILDDREIHYLKVLMDEIFGRPNFCGSLIWEKKKKPSFLHASMGTITDYILAYARDRSKSPPFYFGTTTANKNTPINNAGNALKILKFAAGR